MNDNEIQEIIGAILKDARLQKTVVEIVRDFITKKQEQAAENNAARGWDKISDGALRQAYHYRRRKGKDIEPELAAEMARRFKGFDAEARCFSHRGRKAAAPNPYKKLSKNDLAAKYHVMRMHGEEIDDDLNAELKRRFNRYDAETRTFREDMRGKKTKPLQDLADNTLKTKYYAMRRAGKKIPNDMNEELARRFPNYNKETWEFVNLRGGYVIAEEPKPAQPKPAPTPKKTKTENGDLIVETKMTKISPDGVFYDVYVNGKRILRNNVDTKVQTFLDGTVLGVYGIATDIAELPTKPSWQIYDANLHRRTFDNTDSITKKQVYIKSIRETGDGTLDLWVSNNMHVYPSKKDLGRIFKIMTENEKQK